MFLPNSLRLRPGVPHWKSFPLTIAVATTALAAELTPASLAQEAKPPEVAIATEAPVSLMEAAKKSEPAVFFTMPQSGTKVIPFAGFFIGGDGLALCPLNPLLDKTVPVFRTGADGATELKKPVVLGVFPDEELALLKFDHKPAATLTLSAAPATVGTWVAVVPSAFAKGGKPVTGPIVAHRIATSHSYAKPPRPPEKQFSPSPIEVFRKMKVAFANGRRALRAGDPWRSPESGDSGPASSGSLIGDWEIDDW